MKKLIIGGPKTGKSTYADKQGMPVRRADQLVGEKSWGEDSAEVARWMDEPGDLVIEGAAVVRGLRKWMVTHPTGRLDGVEVVKLSRPYGSLNDGQARMGKGVDTIWSQIRADLVRRGASVKD